jgi:inner membrane protein
VNHTHVQKTVEGALEEQSERYNQFMITPTIFNNLLWNVVVDAGDEFLLAQYSILDEVPIAFHSVSKGYDLLQHMDADETIGVLQWFSAGYLNAVRREDGVLQLNDLRFGTFSGRAENADDYIFRFELFERELGQPYGFKRAEGGPPNMKAEEMMMGLIERAGGLSNHGLTD